MYKVFESRKPFEYGVTAFDNLLKTTELPFSFCLYQEQEMAALHYAGIPMSDCYVAIKDIAKKRAEKVYAYREKFIAGFKDSIVNDEGKTEEEALPVAEKLWQIIEDSARYSFNASHSYCVSCDSLYIAWVKAHYPLETYETLLKFYDSRGEKDKMAEAKEEAKRFFGIKFPPLLYGEDNRAMKADKKNNQITASISSIKGFSQSIGQRLWDSAKTQPSNFTDVLIDLHSRGIKAKVEPLIKIDYFREFGNQRELERMYAFWEFFKQGEAKTIKKERVAGSYIEDIIRKYSTCLRKDGSEAASYTLTDVRAILYACEAKISTLGLEDYSPILKAARFNEAMGYNGYVSGREEDRAILFIKEVIPARRKKDGKLFGYGVLTRSLGSGIESRFTVFKEVYQQDPIKKDDVIRCLKYRRDSKGYFTMERYVHLMAEDPMAELE